MRGRNKLNSGSHLDYISASRILLDVQRNEMLEKGPSLQLAIGKLQYSLAVVEEGVRAEAFSDATTSALHGHGVTE